MTSQKLAYRLRKGSASVWSACFGNQVRLVQMVRNDRIHRDCTLSVHTLLEQIVCVDRS
jgi:hypothetical protein